MRGAGWRGSRGTRRPRRRSAARSCRKARAWGARPPAPPSGRARGQGAAAGGQFCPPVAAPCPRALPRGGAGGRAPHARAFRHDLAADRRRAGADAFLGSLAILPLACGLPGVATVHDLTPILFPEWHSRKNRLGFTPFIGATVRRARRIAAVSE